MKSTAEINSKPIGYARPSDMTRLAIGVDIGSIEIRRVQDDHFTMPLYSKADDWKIMK